MLKHKPKQRAGIQGVAALSLCLITAVAILLASRTDNTEYNAQMKNASAALPTMKAAVQPISSVTEESHATETSMAAIMAFASPGTAFSVPDAPIPEGSTTGVKAISVIDNSKACLYAEHSFDSEILCPVPVDAVVAVLGSIGNWYEVSYNGQTGYMYRLYIKPLTSAQFSSTAQVSIDQLTVSSVPGDGGLVICWLFRGAYVSITGFDNGWFTVKGYGYYGYANGDELVLGVTAPPVTVSSPSPAPQPEEVVVPATTDTTKTDGQVETETVEEQHSVAGDEIVDTALQYLGCSYSYGGSGPSSFDCSGFTMYIFAQYGISLPHGATGQYGYGTGVSKAELQPGDLVFFSSDGNAIGHVGIYIGSNEFIHASTYGVGVITNSLDFGTYPSRYVGARRIVN